MKPSIFADAVITASSTSDGHALAQLFSIGSPLSASILLNLGPPHRIVPSLRKCNGYLSSPWEEMCSSHLLALHSFSIASSLPSSDTLDAEGKTKSERLVEAFESYNTAVTAFLRYFATLTPGRWALPLLRILCLNLRWLAVQSDSSTVPSSTARVSNQPNKRLEECARQLNKAFTACIADRNPELSESRKWGVYEVVGMVFKTYFRLKSVSLCRNILRAINAAVLPGLEEFPRSQQVTFRYYVGVLAFLNEEYGRAEVELEAALKGCAGKGEVNERLILAYLVPVKLVKGYLPNAGLLRGLEVYEPFVSALQAGDVRAFDAALKEPAIERWLVKRGTYIAIERVRDVTLRTLLKKIWLSLEGRPTRISLDTIGKATRLKGLEYSTEELEWVLATLIYKGYVKGYIAHERGVVVLSAKEAFPRLSAVVVATT